MICCALALSEHSHSADLLARAAAVKLALFDVDGVLTDGAVVLGPFGSEHKAFNARDGQGLVMLRKAGIEVGIISGRTSPAVEERMRALGIEYVYQGQTDKLAALVDLLAKLKLAERQVAYVGDDLPDLAILCKAGLAIAVADADPFVAHRCHWRTVQPGGRGAVREVCELLLAAQDKLEPVRRKYLDSGPGG